MNTHVVQNALTAALRAGQGKTALLLVENGVIENDAGFDARNRQYLAFKGIV